MFILLMAQVIAQKLPLLHEDRHCPFVNCFCNSQEKLAKQNHYHYQLVLGISLILFEQYPINI